MKLIKSRAWLAFVLITLLAKGFNVANANVVQGTFNQHRTLLYGVVSEPQYKPDINRILIPALHLVSATLEPELKLAPSKTSQFDFIIEVTDRVTAQRHCHCLLSWSSVFRRFTQDIFRSARTQTHCRDLFSAKKR